MDCEPELLEMRGNRKIEADYRARTSTKVRAVTRVADGPTAMELSAGTLISSRPHKTR